MKSLHPVVLNKSSPSQPLLRAWLPCRAEVGSGSPFLGVITEAGEVKEPLW